LPGLLELLLGFLSTAFAIFGEPGMLGKSSVGFSMLGVCGFAASS